MLTVYSLIPFSCLIAAVIAGIGGKVIGRKATHRVAISGVAISFVLSLYVLYDVLQGNLFNGTLYIWATSGGLTFEIGFFNRSSFCIDGSHCHFCVFHGFTSTQLAICMTILDIRGFSAILHFSPLQC